MAAVAKFTPDADGEGRALRRLPVDADVRCLEVVGQEVWTGDRDGKLVVRRVRGGEVVSEVRRKQQANAKGNVWCLRLVMMLADKAAGHVWAGLSTGMIIMYDSATKAAVNQVQRHTGGVYQMVDMSGRVYTCGGDFKVIEWRVDTHEVVRQFHGHKANVRCVVPLPGTLLSGSEDTDIRIWDLSTGRSVHVVQHHAKGIHAMAKAGNQVWSSGGSVIKVWDLHTLGLVASLEQHEATVLALTRVGARMYSCAADKTVVAWDLHTHQQVGSFHQHTGWVYALVNVAKAVRYFIWSTSVHDGCVQVWSHDEYHPMDTVAKDTENNITDQRAHNPEAALAEQLQDTVGALQARVKYLENEVDSYQQRTRVLEDELMEQNVALERQLLINQQLSNSLHHAKTATIPGLEKTVSKQQDDVKAEVSRCERKTAEAATMKDTLTDRGKTIKELEQKLAASEADKKKIAAAYEAHKQAHMKYIDCDVDTVMKEAKAREEALRSQAEDLRLQLAASLKKRRVREMPNQEDLEEEARRALSAGRPTPEEYDLYRKAERAARSPPPGFVPGPAPETYHFKRYYGGTKAATAAAAAAAAAPQEAFTPAPPREPARPRTAAAHSDTAAFFSDRMIMSPSRPQAPATVRAHGARSVSFQHRGRPPYG